MTVAADHTRTPERILQVGLGFWAAKTLLSAVEMELFTELAKRPAQRRTAGGAPRTPPALVRATFSTRSSRSASSSATGGVYANTPDTDLFLDKRKPSYIGGILEMANHAPVRLLEPPHRSAAHRRTAERSQERRPVVVRGALRRPGAPARVPAGDDRHQPRRQPGDRREVSVAALPHRSSTSARPRAISPCRWRARTRTSPASASISPRSDRSSTTTSGRTASRIG